MSRPPPPTQAAAAQAGPAPPRLHVDASLAAGAELMLAPAQAHYLGAVMRRAAGDTVRLFNGTDGEFLATIVELRRDRCRVLAGTRTRPQAGEADVWLVFALLKRGPTELIVQKATELGVAALLPVLTLRTNAERINLARLQAIATEAAEQSERLTVPHLRVPRPLEAVLAGWPSGRRLVACIERSDRPRPRFGEGRPDGLLIGPEGGFTAAELDAIHARPFVEAASLGPRVLRAETAAIAGLALIA